MLEMSNSVSGRLGLLWVSLTNRILVYDLQICICPSHTHDSLSYSYSSSLYQHPIHTHSLTLIGSIRDDRCEQQSNKSNCPGLISFNFCAAILDAAGFKDAVARGWGVEAAAHGLATSAFANEEDAFPFAAIIMALPDYAFTMLFLFLR